MRIIRGAQDDNRNIGNKTYLVSNVASGITSAGKALAPTIPRNCPGRCNDLGIIPEPPVFMVDIFAGRSGLRPQGEAEFEGTAGKSD